MKSIPTYPLFTYILMKDIITNFGGAEEALEVHGEALEVHGEAPKKKTSERTYISPVGC